MVALESRLHVSHDSRSRFQQRAPRCNQPPQRHPPITAAVRVAVAQASCCLLPQRCTSWLAGAQPYVRVLIVICVAPAISRSAIGVPSLECVARSMPRRCRRGLATTASKVPQQSQVVPERAGSQGIDCASLHPTRRGSPLPHLSPPYVLAAAVVTQPPATLTPFARCSLAQVTVSPRGDSVSVGDGPVDTNPRFHAQW